MKTVILAGGYGTRITEESYNKPKPMIEIGNMPMLWHIMKYYSCFGFNDFVICAGYRQSYIKDFFADYFYHSSDITFDFSTGENKTVIHHSCVEPWKVTISDTGLDTMTGGRIKRIKEYLGDEPFMLTYGDGLGNIDLNALLDYHKSHGKLMTLSTYNAGQRFGIADINADGSINEFREKTSGDGNMINIGFMVCQPEVLEYIDGDSTMLEKEPLTNLASDGQLMAYRHRGFWQCVDNLKEKNILEKMWNENIAPWKIW